MTDEKVIIAGGGITGLAAAWYLEKKGYTDIVIVDASDRPGGKVQTSHEHGFLIESGPDSFIVTKPYALDLVRELGMENELTEPKTSRFLVLKNGKLVSAPKGLQMMAPSDLFAFLESRFFSWPGKHRILQESTIPVLDGNEDESFGDFVTRRFGEEMLDLYAGPLFTGIYATPADELSLLATFPMFKIMETEYGSISRAQKKLSAQRSAAGGSNRSTFLGLKNGMQSLTDTLISKLRHTQFALNSSISLIEAGGGYYTLNTADGKTYGTRQLIITLPAAQASALLRNMAPKAADILGGFTCSSSRIVTLAYKKDDVADPMLATGYVSASSEKNMVNAGTWLTSKWDGRAPEGYALLRCFMGKGGALLSYTNDQLIHAAHEEMSRLLGISAEPEYYWVQRWDNALPQYKVGHTARIKTLMDEMSSFKGLTLTGSYLYGVGLPDCIKQGKDAAHSLG